MRLEYKTYKEAKENFTLSERWEVFDWGRENLNIAHECVDRHPKEKTAIRIKFDDGRRETYTFGELSRLTSQFANMLERLGVNAGDRLAVVLNPSLEFYVTLFGALKRGVVVVPCSPLFGPEALDFRLSDSNSKIAIVNKEKASLIRADLVSRLLIAEELPELIRNEDEHYQPDTSADTPAFIQYSSGTTGKPTAVPYRHAAVTFTAVRMKFVTGVRDNDRYFCPSSPAWGHGIWYGSVGPLIFGTGIGAYSGKFDPELFLEALEEFEITVVSAIPTVYRMVMNCGKIDNYKLRVRRLTYTGAALTMDVLRYFQKKLGVIIQCQYGSTEVGGLTLDYAFDDWKVKPGSLGKAMLGTKVAVIDENGRKLPQGQVGEIAVWHRGDWVRMSDAAYIDEDGYFWYKGRIDDIIISAGYTIGPIELESALEKHPAVRKAAVVGSPDKERGEIVKAFIIADREPSEELKQQIQDFIKTSLSKHEYPREIEFVNQLPETPDGKIKRKELKEYERAKKLAKSNH